MAKKYRVIAQDLEKVLPEAVYETVADIEKEEDKTLSYSLWQHSRFISRGYQRIRS